MCKVIFIRPGMTESGRDGKKLGKQDETLLEEERERLLARSKQGCYPEVGRLYSCPSLRCRETAALLYPRLPAILMGELAAFDCGVFEGKTQQELNRDKAFLRWVSSPSMPDCPDGENLNWYAARCLKAIRAIVNEMESYGIEEAALVAHGLSIDLIIQRVCMPRTRYQEQPIPWGGGAILRFSAQQFTASVTEML